MAVPDGAWLGFETDDGDDEGAEVANALGAQERHGGVETAFLRKATEECKWVDAVMFPASVGGAPLVKHNRAAVKLKKLERALAIHAEALRVLRASMDDVNAMVALCLEAVVTVKGATIPAARKEAVRQIDATLTAIHKSVDILVEQTKTTDVAVSGLRKAFVRDVQCGAFPPVTYSKALKHGLPTTSACPVCGSATTDGTSTLSMPLELVGRYFSDKIQHHGKSSQS